MSDLISRQAAIDALDRIFDQCEEIDAHLPKGDPDRTGYKMYPDYMTVWKYLHQLPSAEPEEVIPHRNYEYLSDYWCACGWHLGKKGDVKYCAECGKKVNWGG